MKKEKSAVKPKLQTITIEKMKYALVSDVFYTVHNAFHSDGFDDDQEVDDRFLAIWHSFLCMVGWTEDEFWEAHDNEKHTCPDCGSHIDDDEDDLELPEVADVKSKTEDKPN